MADGRLLAGAAKRRRFQRRGRFIGADPISDGNIADPARVIPQNGTAIYVYDTDPTLQINNGGGAIVATADLKLLYWGDFWRDSQLPSVSDITTAVQSIINSPYLSELSQYGFQAITGVSSFIVTDPAAPIGRYKDEDVYGMVEDLIDDNKFPEPDEPGGRNVYIVFMPPGAFFAPEGAHTSDTTHDVWPLDPDTVWVGWVNFTTLTNTNVLDSLTTIFSHELVEMISDPESDAWTFPARSTDDDTSEIGDVCAGIYGFVGNVQVASYYSDRLKACVVPGLSLFRSVSLTETYSDLGPPGPNSADSVPAPAGSKCLNGTYTWTLTTQGQQVTLTANVSSYRNPQIAWMVLNSVPPATLNIPVDHSVDILNSFHPMPPEWASVTCQSNGRTLTLSVPAGAGDVFVRVMCIVGETGLPDGYDSRRTVTHTVELSGRTRTMEPRYFADLLRCTLDSMKGLHFAVDRITRFIDKGDIVPSWAQREIVALEVQLASVAKAVAQIERTLTKGDMVLPRAKLIQ